MPSRTLSSLKHAILVLTLVTLAAACGGKRPPALATAAPGEGGDPQAGAGAGQQQPTETIPEGPDVRSIQGEGASGADIPGSGLTSEGGPLADIRFELRQLRAHRRGARHAREARALAAGPARDERRDRGPLRRARHHRVQPRARRAARAHDARVPRRPRRRRVAAARRLLRQGAPARPRRGRSRPRAKPQGALQCPVRSPVTFRLFKGDSGRGTSTLAFFESRGLPSPRTPLWLGGATLW